MTNSKRTRLLSVAVVAVIASGMVAFACGSDDASGSDACTAPDCDGGGAEGSLREGATGDGAQGDGGMGGDADASPMEECDGAGAGTLDPTFGDGGMVWLKYSNGQAYSVAVQADGKIVVGGATAGQNLALVRLLPNGSLDSKFGDAGLVETKIGITNFGFTSLAVQSDGRIVGVNRTVDSDGTQANFSVFRFLPNGALDPAFGNAGVVITDFGNTSDQPASVVLLADGRILAGGQSAPISANPNTDFALARYNTDGSLDTSFGTGGKVKIDVKGTVDRGGYVALAPGGKIVVAGQSATEPPPASTPAEMSAVQLNADGSLDTSFADGGKMVTNFGGTGSQFANAVAVDGTGRVVLGGSYQAGGSADFGVLRLASSGIFDATFGDGGLVNTTFTARSSIAGAILFQEDTKLIVIGSAGAGASTSSIASARYLPNGRIDSTFGTAGQSLTPPPANADLFAPGAAISGCTFVTVGTWAYDEKTLSQNAMGIARFRR